MDFILASWRAGHQHCTWLCVSAGQPQRAQAADGTMPHLWSVALHGNTLASVWRICFFFAEGCIPSKTLPNVSLPWSGRSSHSVVKGRAGVPASAPERSSLRRMARATHCAAARCIRSSRTLASHSTHFPLCWKWTASGSRSSYIGRLSSDSAASCASGERIKIFLKKLSHIQIFLFLFFFQMSRVYFLPKKIFQHP